MSMQDLFVYNTIAKKKEKFEPIKAPNVGMYVCGPTVYSDVHIGNCRTFISFDVIYRYLTFIGYKVRYVRNITDVGHLENDADEGEDKISKRARLDNIEPMEVVQKYTNGFHSVLEQFNNRKPSIEPTATGHLLEQVEYVQKIIDNGYAYESNGSVYFDVEKFAAEYKYGELSGRKIDELQSNTRELTGQDEKRCPLDFVIWKKAGPSHIMQWNSPWSRGFPGWHLECSVMSTKYLGDQFDIHGGGMDLKFPHHESEIAQNTAHAGCGGSVKYWLHSNMLTLNGEKMSKSTGKYFLPQEMFDGSTDLLEKAYSPAVVRFSMMQCHYRSTMDLSNDALAAAEKGLQRIKEALKKLESPTLVSSPEEGRIEAFSKRCFDAMNDDFNAPILVATLFDTVKFVNSNELSKDEAEGFKKLFDDFLVEILGVELSEETGSSEGGGLEEGLVQLTIDLRAKAKSDKDWGTCDLIRDKLGELGVQLKDSKEGTVWVKD
jgi:cysteinyl-tRNA synthetase